MRKWKLFAVALPIFCSIVVLSWFIVCVWIVLPDDAGRGGAIGVIVSFAALFLLSIDRYHSIEILDSSYQTLFESLSDASQEDPRLLIERNAARIDAIKSDLKHARFQTRWENYSLAGSSILSTLFWGFGDIFASWLV